MKWIKGTGMFLAALLVLSSFAHSLGGLPPLQQALKQAGVEPGSELWIDATAGWLFGSMSMLAFGIIFGSVVLSLSKTAVNLVPIVAIGLGYVVFGIGCLLMLHRGPHFVMFGVLGLLFLIWGWVAGRFAVALREPKR